MDSSVANEAATSVSIHMINTRSAIQTGITGTLIDILKVNT